MDLLMNVNSMIVSLEKNKTGITKIVKKDIQKSVAHVNLYHNVVTSTVSVLLMKCNLFGKLWIPTWMDKSI